METGLDLMNIGGTNVWVGAVFSQRDLKLNAERIVRNLITIKGLHNYIPADLDAAVRFMTRHHRQYPFRELVGAEYPLDQLDQAFAAGETGAHYRIGIRPIPKDLNPNP